MKKFFAFALVASMMTLAACSGKSEGTTTDSTAVAVDTTVAVDTAMAVDTAAAMVADSTKK
jgi:lipoprotein NlpI